MSLPPIPPGLVADAVEALPNRLKSRLDATLPTARGWAVETAADRFVVTVDDETRVTLTVPVGTAADIVCSCLLSPKCLHRTAVMCIAPIADDAPTPADSGSAPVPAPAPAPAPADDTGTAPGDRAPTDGAPSDSAPGDAAPSGSKPAVPKKRTARKAAKSGEPAATTPDAAEPARPDQSEPDAVRTGLTGATRVSKKTTATPTEADGEVTAEQRAAARRLAAVTATMLARGVTGAGATVQADLLRAIHQARAVGLPRPAAAATRVVAHLRAAHAEDPSFRLVALVDDVRELLTVCRILTTGLAGLADARGVARRDYEPVGDLRLSGMFCEPVAGASGHIGVATYLADASGRVWTVVSVRPADGRTLREATAASVDIGDIRLAHRDLARAGVRTAQATASPDGRLSHGKGVQAVRAEGCSWYDGPLDRLFRQPPADQVARWLTGADGATPDAGHDLAFLDGVVLGVMRGDLPGTTAGSIGFLVSETGAVVVLRAPLDEPSLPYVANLRLLAAEAAGRPVRLVGRFAGHRTLHVLAFAAPWLPVSFRGHVDLGVDELRKADLPGPPTADELAADLAAGLDSESAAQATAAAETAGQAPGSGAGKGEPPEAAEPQGGTGEAPEAAEPPAAPAAPEGKRATAPMVVQVSTPPAPPPLHLLRHHVERTVSAGRGALLASVRTDVHRLAEAQLTTGAALLDALAGAATHRTRDVFGRLDPVDAERFADAWLAAAAYERAATRHTMLLDWQ